MARKELIVFFVATIVMAASPSSSSPSWRPPPHHGIKGGYWPSWLAETAPPSQIPTKYFTHLFYAFVLPDSITYELTITPYDHQWMTNFTTTIRSKKPKHRHGPKPKPKTFISLGGGGGAPQTFANMAQNHDNRARFIKSTINVARKYNFDGLDLDWEFPQNPQDMSNLADLFREWRAACDAEAHASKKPRLLLSAAVYFASNFFLSGTPRTFPSDAIKNYADFVNTMCYDYHGSWDTSVTGSHALLFDKSSNISTSYGLSTWIQSGVARNQLVMGLPAYGRTWKLKDPKVNGIGAPAVGVGPSRPGDVGVLLYKEVVDFNLANNATEVYDDETVSTYSYAGTDWIGYDGHISIWKKVKYAKSQGLGGYFFWAVGYDNDLILTKTAAMAWDSQF